MSWIKESNRPKHLLYAIPAGALLSILFVSRSGGGMEFKDELGVANGTGLTLPQR